MHNEKTQNASSIAGGIMKSRFVAVAALVFASLAFAQGVANADVPPAAQESKRVYGDKGTLEFGINGMAGGGSSKGSQTDQYGNTSTFPMKTYNGSFAFFGKYYVVDRVHVGGTVMGNFQLAYNDQDELQSGNGQLTFYAEGGYAIPVMKGAVLDLAGGLGLAEVFLTWDPIPCFIFNVKPMLLFPIGQNALIGVGMMVTRMTIDHSYDINDDSDYAGTTIKVTSVNVNALAQLSIYF
jgi:hypothetical protein